MTRRIITGVPALKFGEGRDCTLPASLAIATKSDYDWVMGCSGASFETKIDNEQWDPLAAAPLDDATLERGARAVGVTTDVVVPPFDDEMRELVLARVMEGIDGGVPPLVRGLGGPPEYGLIVGYDTEGPTFLARTYFDKGKEPARAGWEAFESAERGTPVFLDAGTTVEEKTAALAGLDAAVASSEASDAALRAWIDGLRDDTRWTDAKHAGSAAFGDHAMRLLLADKRRSAARFLRSLRTMYASLPGADLLRAAESYGYVADAAERGGTGPFDGTVAMRFLDAGQRRAWANLLEGALAHEASAHESLRSARARMRS
ncbi:MAG: hypothetical protein HY071_00745 [Chloroflexi bacterium]|nr:hypothetical protein [Chloroflexota bacterium]